MSILDLTGVDFNDVVEPTTLPKGEEAKLRIISFKEGVDKNDVKYVMPFFESTTDPYCKEFGDYIPLPHAEMSPKDLNKAKLRLAHFATAFGIDLTLELDPDEDVIGNEGWAILGMGTDMDDLPVNKISKYVVGK